MDEPERVWMMDATPKHNATAADVENWRQWLYRGGDRRKTQMLEIRVVGPACHQAPRTSSQLVEVVPSMTPTLKWGLAHEDRMGLYAVHLSPAGPWPFAA